MKILICAALLTTLLAVPAAYAQHASALQPGPGAPTPGTANPPPPVSGKAEPRAINPPALPGARAEPTQVAPADKNVMDLAPTEALFDAINRGDLPATKDSINRGADLYGKNVLGLTPIELAVDLGRNEISFYLLSLRGGISASEPTGPATAPKPPSRAEMLASERAARAEREAQKRASLADAKPAPPRTPRLFAGDGGTPIPQAGFLGFGSVR